MLFNSFNFLLLFFPLVLWRALRLEGQALLRWITLASYVFYALTGQSWFLIPMLVTTVLDYFLAQQIEVARSKELRLFLLGISLLGNLGLLMYFKYSGLFVRTAICLFRGSNDLPWLRYFDVILPAGISFYTFQTLSYIIDVYKGTAKAEYNFWEFAAFVSFFPHLVAGPLTRHHQLIPQLQRIKSNGISPRWNEGVLLFAFGLCKKTLMADRIGNLIDPLLADFSRVGLPAAWLLVLGYALQIYFDFSGYSDMAIGLARLFDIELPQNFDSPYKSVSPTDFWHRWHITLSQWLRDYLYIPLGGNRRNILRNLTNLMITMFLGGLWHGAQWTFGIWGLYHGGLMVLYYLNRSRWDAFPLGVQRFITFLLVCIGWIPFRAHSIYEAKTWMARLLGFHGFLMNQLNPTYERLAGFVLLGLFVVEYFPNASHSQQFKHFPPAKQFALGFITVFAVLCMNYSSKFLYFQF
jgi:alginate O-acetyltransferase complex protein AlgI